MPQVPLLNYPLFTIQVGDLIFAEVEGPSPRDGTTIKALAIFSHQAIAEAFWTHLGVEARLAAIPSAMQFRALLGEQRPPVFGVAFDPYVRDGRITMRWFGEIDDVLAALPEANFMWRYPIFALRTGEGEFAALSYTMPDGSPSVGAALFTDEDLALRYIEAMQLAGELQSLASADEMGEFLRTQSADMVCFDAVSTPQGPRSNFAVAKAVLLRDLFGP